MQQIGLLETKDIESIILQDAELRIFSSTLSQMEAQTCMESLMNQVEWQKETIRIAGIDKLCPRLTAWYGEPEAKYRYSGINHKPNPWTGSLLKIKQIIEDASGFRFNSALCNLYRNGQDSVAWHSDDEPDLYAENGEPPIIASLSLGATRTFQMKHKIHKGLRHNLPLTSGSLLIMKGNTQKHWLHQVPKEKGITEPRINITFRTIYNNKN